MRADMDAAEPKYCQRVIQMAVSKVFGRKLSIAEIAKICGISERAAYKWRAHHKEDIAEVVSFISPLLLETTREIKQVMVDDFRQELEGELGTFLDAIRRASTSGDPKVALAGAQEGLNRIFGKAASTLNVKGDITRRTITSIDPETLRVLSDLTKQSETLYSRAAALALPAAIDVEPS